jgi:VIT1/CCC1 family predicted Fe2+/Mn2+ transporter
MLTELTTKAIIDMAFLLVTLVLGVILHKTGKPYQQLILALHKIGTLGFGVLIAILLVHQLNGLGGDAWLVVCFIIAGISLLALVASGALLSADKPHDAMLKVHRVATLLLLFSTTGIFYELFNP